MRRPGRGEAVGLLLLLLLPAAAHGPALWEGRLLGPGDGAALHYPARALVWEAYRRGELPAWNPAIFLGTPLLAAYRPGAFYPPMALGALLPPYAAFQSLVLLSLGAAAVLVHLYVRRLGGGPVGAYVAGLSFSLGPYLVGHLGDTATVVAAPLLPLVLLAAESHVNRSGTARAAGLSAALALLLLAGSPEAARAGLALLAARLAVAHGYPRTTRGPTLGASAAAVAAGLALAAPQVLPSLLALKDAGRTLTGLATVEPALPGATGLVLRYVSHTPAPSFALAALPLIASRSAVRVHGLALALCLALQWRRGPLAAPGALALVFDFALATLAGLSLSAQWAARREPLGRRLRTYLLFASLASAAALSVSAAALGPLPQNLTASVGVLAMAMILYLSLAPSPRLVSAGVWLLPLTVSFLLQPHGRRVWASAPTRAQLEEGSPTRLAIDDRLGVRRRERVLTLTRSWPAAEAYDLAFGSLAVAAGRRAAEGYDPLVALRTRALLGGMGVAGALPGAFFRGDPARLELLGIRWAQLPASGLRAEEGPGEPLDLVLEPGRPRVFPVPIMPATTVAVESHLSEAVAVPDGLPVAEIELQLASGRTLAVPLRAGLHTAEWAHDRPDVAPRVAHRRAPIAGTRLDAGGFAGHSYLGRVELPGRYWVQGVRLARPPGEFHLTLRRLSLEDTPTARVAGVTQPAAFVSDTAHFREAAVTPMARLYELPNAVPAARVVAEVRALPDDEAVLRALGTWRAAGLDVRRHVVARADEAAAIALPALSRPGRAEMRRVTPGRIDVRADGPGLLVVAESWDAGWTVTLDGEPAPVHRVNHSQLAAVVPAGVHRASFRYAPPGLGPGLVLCGLAALGALGAGVKEARARR